MTVIVSADFCKQMWKPLVNIKEFLLDTMSNNYFHSKSCREKLKFDKSFLSYKSLQESGL